MIKRKPKSFKGLDTSGPNMVLAPTFGGVRELVDRYGQSTAESMVSHPDLDGEDSSKDLVRSFLDDLTYADKVQRQEMIRDFSHLVRDLRDAAKKPPQPEPQPDPQPEPQPDPPEKSTE